VDPSQYGLLAMPCVFRGTNEPMMFMSDVARTNSVANQLFNAEMTLKSNPADPTEAIKNIQAVLAAVPAFDRQTAGWSAAYYADLAIKAGLRSGNREMARAILSRGLQLEPESKQLQYLQRILIREQLLQNVEPGAKAHN
jgi:hypothetical protein